MIWVALNAAACAVNVWVYAMWHSPLNLAVAVFSGLMALGCAVMDT